MKKDRNSPDAFTDLNCGIGLEKNFSKEVSATLPHNIWKSRFFLGRGKCFEIVRFGSMGIEIRLFN